MNDRSPADVALSVTETRRWAVVGLGVALLVALLVGVPRWLPARADPISAGRLLEQVQAAHGRPFSGLVVSRGSLGLPVTDEFSDLAGLFGQQTRLRAWWRDADAWRVDQITTTGETDLIHDDVGTTTWDYESNRATRTGPAVIRLPNGSDLLPPTLAHLMLETATGDQVTRLDSRRVAGRSAAGLRFTPNDPRTSIGHVDLWVEPASGLPLAVDVYASGARHPGLSTAFASVSLRRPAVADVQLVPASGVRQRFEEVTDLAAAANAFAPVIAPPALAGLSRRDGGAGAVGIYGRGVTELVAIPLSGRVAGPLRSQLLLTPGVVDADAGLRLAAPPLHLLLTPPTATGRTWLLAGTVTAELLSTAAAEVVDEQLPANPQAARP